MILQINLNPNKVSQKCKKSHEIKSKQNKENVMNFGKKLQLNPQPEWSNGTQHCAHCTDGHGFESLTSTNACGHVYKYVDQKGSAAMLTSIQSAGVTSEVNLKITHVRKCGRDPPWLWNPGQTSPEVQNRGTSGPTKRTYVLQIFKKQKAAIEKTFYDQQRITKQKKQWDLGTPWSYCTHSPSSIALHRSIAGSRRTTHSVSCSQISRAILDLPRKLLWKYQPSDNCKLSSYVFYGPAYTQCTIDHLYSTRTSWNGKLFAQKLWNFSAKLWT